MSLETALILGAYFIGGIPFGYLIAKSKGIDLRQVGSGNIGATNTSRVLGKKYGIIVYILDFLKGFIPTWIAVKLYGLNSSITALVGLATILGHCFSPYMGFKGGKGVATASGVLFAISYILGFIALVIWFIICKITKYVSLASILTALISIYIAGMMHMPLWAIILITLAACIILVRHSSNIERLFKGEENKVKC
jgi:glycerol-3-phosphate acyltransferase PlsY